MSKKQRDRHLDVPAEANRDKHINFIARENNDTDPSDEAPKGLLADTGKRNAIKEKKSKKAKRTKDQ